MKVVLDANVYISGLLGSCGNAKTILSHWEAGKIEVLITPDILTELSRVLRYPKIIKLHQWTEREIAEFLTLLSDEATLVSPQERLGIVIDDESDNRYLECAVAGGAAYLVAGGKKYLLPVKEYQGIQIVSPAVFLAVFELEG